MYVFLIKMQFTPKELYKRSTVCVCRGLLVELIKITKQVLLYLNSIVFAVLPIVSTYSTYSTGPLLGGNTATAFFSRLEHVILNTGHWFIYQIEQTTESLERGC